MNNKIMIVGMFFLTTISCINGMDYASKLLGRTRKEFGYNMFSSLFIIGADNIYSGKKSNILDLNKRTYAALVGGWAINIVGNCLKSTEIMSVKRADKLSRIVKAGVNVVLHNSFALSLLAYSLYNNDRDRLAQAAVGSYLGLNWLAQYNNPEFFEIL
jgi:hypothetical protein